MRKIIIIGLVMVFLIFIGLMISISPKKVIPTPTPVEKETPPETPKITLPKVLYNLAGTVKNYDKYSITLEATIPQLDESGSPTQKIEIRKALVSSTTKFTRLSFVVQPGTNRQTPVEKTITFKEIKLGDYIEVRSNQDISQKPEFEATQITVLP